MNREGIRRLAAEELKLPTSPYQFVDNFADFQSAVEKNRYSLRGETDYVFFWPRSKYFGNPKMTYKKPGITLNKVVEQVQDAWL